MSRIAQCISLQSFCRNEYRSRLFVSAALRLTDTRLHSAPLTDSTLIFGSYPVDTMTPLACRDAPAPAAAPARSSHHASHRVRRCLLSTCLTLSDSFARRTRGSDSPLESGSLPSHPVAALTRAAGPGCDSLPDGRTGTCTGGRTKRRLQGTSATCRSLCRAGPTGANYISRSTATGPVRVGGCEPEHGDLRRVA
jgi:hypothetical protein